VPQVWFLHFYLLGACCNALVLLLFCASLGSTSSSKYHPSPSEVGVFGPFQQWRHCHSCSARIADQYMLLTAFKVSRSLCSCSCQFPLCLCNLCHPMTSGTGNRLAFPSCPRCFIHAAGAVSPAAGFLPAASCSAGVGDKLCLEVPASSSHARHRLPVWHDVSSGMTHREGHAAAGAANPTAASPHCK